MAHHAATCSCDGVGHEPALVVVTGGPGAGKTAVLELARRAFCDHVVVMPESAGIIFGGGFPRRSTDAGTRAVQRAIFHVERQLEWLHQAEGEAAIVLCDRGTLDGLAYWPGEDEEFLAEVGTSLQQELARYRAVVHLRTPSEADGYDNSNPHRIETAAQAARVDDMILRAWADHPDRITVEAGQDFRAKAAAALDEIARHVPDCCRT